MHRDDWEREVSFKIPLIGAAVIGLVAGIAVGWGLGLGAAFFGFVLLLVGVVLFTPPKPH
jgi:hypothetical protein